MDEKALDYPQQVLAAATDGADYSWVGTYSGNPHLPLQIQHVANCGFKFELTPSAFAAGKRCYIHQHCGWQG
ncbi:hypothetical protein [Loigolactobacillus jiayinensis]|uniref:Uncharacterized protein n=1 Tax=Loigolactobacillus jiayinensis TaxID=2486016 RepID=A0ABW1R9P3_9LACO|nr:hypothetical protein [Loigolactobacillus jiayinensis]